MREERLETICPREFIFPIGHVRHARSHSQKRTALSETQIFCLIPSSIIVLLVT